MIQLFILCALLALGQSQVGTTPCTSYGSQSACDASGYCHWETICRIRPCYMVDEIAACRSGSPLPTGALATTQCDSLETFSLQYDNVCCDKNEGRLNYAFVRFSFPTETATATTASDTTPIATIAGTVDTTNMFKLYTLSIIKCTTQTEVDTILSHYQTTYQTLLTTSSSSHPFYMERVIYQSLQWIRDYQYLTNTGTAITQVTRAATLTRIWAIGDNLMKRIISFSPNYYQTNYYFVNFASIPFNRLSLTVQGQLNTVTVTWTTYTIVGYMQVVSIAPEQFGHNNALSDVLMIKPVDANSAVQGTFAYTLTWTWSDPNLSVVGADVKLYNFHITNGVAAAQETCTMTCTQATKTCVASGANLQGNKNYYFSYTPGLCNSKNEYQCRNSYGTCAWNTATSICS